MGASFFFCFSVEPRNERKPSHLCRSAAKKHHKNPLMPPDIILVMSFNTLGSAHPPGAAI